MDELYYALIHSTKPDEDKNGHEDRANRVRNHPAFSGSVSECVTIKTIVDCNT